jgi:hypothetical protein
MKSLVEIERVWEGQTAAVFASGPSMTRDQAESCRGLRCIAINNQSFDCAPWADIIYSTDRKWWVEYLPRVRELPGRKLSVQIGQPLDGVEYLRLSKLVFDDRPGFISTGGNSGYAALCLAAKLGASRVLLFGFDMREVNGRARRHDYPSKLNSKPRFNYWLPRFKELAPELAKRKVEVINCTPGSALRCFPLQSAARARVA